MKYNIIYADPPWQYQNYNAPESIRGARKEYPTMTTEDICGLPVASLADDDAVLFIWGTWTHLPDILQVITAWGFEYKTVGFVWVKSNKSGMGTFLGMGTYTRSNTEYCLLGTRGKLRRVRADVRQVIYAPLMQHSRKPNEVRDRIVRLMGDLPRVELFARQRVDGWDAWGNEVSNSLHLTTKGDTVTNG